MVNGITRHFTHHYIHVDHADWVTQFNDNNQPSTRVHIRISRWKILQISSNQNVVKSEIFKIMEIQVTPEEHSTLHTNFKQTRLFCLPTRNIFKPFQNIFFCYNSYHLHKHIKQIIPIRIKYYVLCYV